MTGLLGGPRIPKSHKRIVAYGTVDELNSYIGLLASLPGLENHQSLLTRIQHDLFTIGAMLADICKDGKSKVIALDPGEITFLETSIDEFEKKLPELKNFILPGGHPSVGHCHIARCVCRRAERCIVALSTGDEISPAILAYMNRLSDWLFVLARILAKELRVKELPWFPTT